MQHTHDFIADNIRFQKRTSIFIYPIAGVSGFMMGGAIGSGNINKMMQNKYVLISMIITIAILTPLSHWLASWMYKVSYGKCLKELKERIDELENPT
jgi:hypothetical protein